MRNSLLFLLLLISSIVSPVTSSFAGYRYYGSGHGNHYYSRSTWYHHSHHYGHPYYSDHIWADVGIGLLTGAVIGSVLFQPPRQPAIIYNSPPPVIYYQAPVILNQSYSQISSQPEQVLRRVRTTPELLNFRSAPNLYAAINGRIPRNAILDVLGEAPGWLYIRTEPGQYGWIMTKYTQKVQGPVG